MNNTTDFVVPNSFFNCIVHWLKFIKISFTTCYFFSFMVTHLLFFFSFSDPFTKNKYDTIFILSYLLCKDYPYNFFYPNNFFSCLDHQGLACKIIGVWCVKSLDYSTEPLRGLHTLESHWTSKYYILHSTVNGAIIV